MDTTKARAAAVLSVLGLFLLVVASAAPIPRYSGPLPFLDRDGDGSADEPQGLPCPSDPESAEEIPAWCDFDQELPEEAPDLEEQLGDSATLDLSWLEPVFAVIALLSVLGLLIFGSYVLLTWLRERGSHRADPVEVIEDLKYAAETTSKARGRALVEGSPPNAVVACWVALEDAAEGAGLHRTGSETAQEFTERVLAHWEVDAATITELAELYRAARFSRQELTEDHRQRAAACLEKVHSAIQDRRNQQEVP
ncbi:DUF4129 domain-containing protein [Nesterenkonia ebinurensis]|uniref:DUF4129 domain-containing protein n=1 Tax=Nesterenkonia ebinurensis TaxID=2608252 RepID=UPI00168B0EA8|nr:DUF4129 domain-containing protein [Nesterenkonia ebinurensis]